MAEEGKDLNRVKRMHHSPFIDVKDCHIYMPSYVFESFARGGIPEFLCRGESLIDSDHGHQNVSIQPLPFHIVPSISCIKHDMLGNTKHKS